MHAPRALAAAGAARHLLEQLEGPLGGAEVGQVQRLIGLQHADQRHAREVVALGHHLRPDQDVDLARVHARAGSRRGRARAARRRRCRDRAARRARRGSARARSPRRARCRCPAARGASRLARRAALGHVLQPPAVVADAGATARGGRSSRPRSSGSGRRGRRRGTARQRREAAPVEEQDALLARRQRGAERVGQRRRQQAVGSGRMAAQVDDLDLGQRPRRRALGQRAGA